MVNIATSDEAKTAEEHREAQHVEYNTYRATEEIRIDNVLAFGEGYPVPKSFVEKNPELLEEGAVEEVSADAGGMPAETDKRAAWVDYAKSQGAPASELAAVSSGGLSRNDLAAKYGLSAQDQGTEV